MHIQKTSNKIQKTETNHNIDKNDTHAMKLFQSYEGKMKSKLLVVQM